MYFTHVRWYTRSKRTYITRIERDTEPIIMTTPPFALPVALQLPVAPPVALPVALPVAPTLPLRQLSRLRRRRQARAGCTHRTGGGGRANPAAVRGRHDGTARGAIRWSVCVCVGVCVTACVCAYESVCVSVCGHAYAPRGLACIESATIERYAYVLVYCSCTVILRIDARHPRGRRAVGREER